MRATRAAAARCTKPRVAGHVEIVEALLAAGADAACARPATAARRGSTPRAVVTSNVLERLLPHHPDAARSRTPTAATR